MNSFTRIKITASPRSALAKLSRAGIPVRGCEKQGARFAFGVPDKMVKKVFAIFASPCYNIVIDREGPFSRFKRLCARRAFLVAGGALFVAAAVLSNAFVLRIEVTGSGAYLKNPVLSELHSLGVERFTLWRGVNEPALVSRVLALPDVVFCSVQKRGSVLYVDVQTEEGSASPADYSPLKSDCRGVVESIVAVSGTPLVVAGQSVRRGEELIGAYFLSEGEKVPCMAAGYAVLSCMASVSYAAARESEENLRSAYAAALLYVGDERITASSHTVSRNAEGVVYTVEYTYLHTLSINFG